MIKYKGILEIGQKYQNKSDLNVVVIENILKYNGVFSVDIKYLDSITKKGKNLILNAYDFEKQIQWGTWKRIEA